MRSAGKAGKSELHATFLNGNWDEPPRVTLPVYAFVVFLLNWTSNTPVFNALITCKPYLENKGRSSIIVVVFIPPGQFAACPELLSRMVLPWSTTIDG